MLGCIYSLICINETNILHKINKIYENKVVYAGNVCQNDVVINIVSKAKNIDQDIMKRELMKLTYNKNYRTQFSDEPADNLWWMAHGMVEQFLKEGYTVFNAEQMLREGIY
jgi:phage antirepressor YoqD-like protein